MLYPADIDDLEFRKILAEEGVQSAGGVGKFAGKMLRIGHMGNADQHTMISTIAAIERSLLKLNPNYSMGAGITAYLKCITGGQNNED